MAFSAPARIPRQKRSRETRARILRSATELFVERGYVATTMADIAAASRVAVQSLYLRFGGKAEILAAAFDVAIVGDDGDQTLLERPWFEDLEASPKTQIGIEIFVAEVQRLMDRTYPLFAVISSASAHETAALLALNKSQRAEGLRAVAGALAKKEGFRTDLGLERATDILYAIVSEDHYGLLVADRGWTSDEWAAWCSELLLQNLCGVAPKAASKPADNKTPSQRRSD